MYTGTKGLLEEYLEVSAVQERSSSELKCSKRKGSQEV
jgi:hypothetical protein